jgi:hypothetical protein
MAECAPSDLDSEMYVTTVCSFLNKSQVYLYILERGSRSESTGEF